MLWNLIRHLKQNDLDAAEQEFAFWSRIARTVAILFAALLASAPSCSAACARPALGARTLLGVLIGVTVLPGRSAMLESGALVFDASPVVLAAVPDGAAGAASH